MSILIKINKLKYSEGVFDMGGWDWVSKLWPEYDYNYPEISPISFKNMIFELSAHELTPKTDKDFLLIAVSFLVLNLLNI